MKAPLIATVLIADGPNGSLYATSVPGVQFVDGGVCDTRFGSWLRPYPGEDEARAALIASGGANIRKEGAK